MNDLFAKERQQWIDDCQAAARKLLMHREEITIEDVLVECPRPKYIHRNTTGRVFNHPDFRMIGFRKSRRAISKGRWVMCWTLDAEAFQRIKHQTHGTKLLGVLNDD